MAALNPENTGRVFISYLVGGEEHVLQLRYGPSSNAVTALSTAAEMFAFMDSALYSTDIIRAESSSVGTSVRLPETWPGDSNYGTGTPPAGQEMKFISLTGKSVLGRRWRLEWFGVNVTIPAAWRMGLGVNSSFDDMREHVALALATSDFVCIDNEPGLINAYYNFKYADHEIGKARGG